MSGTTGADSLAAYGLAAVALLDPLGYPGPPVPWPALLLDDRLLRLSGGGPPGGRTAGPDGGGLDAVLRGAGAAPVANRVPVLAVGSNGSPGQLRHKLRTAGVPVAVPMLPATAGGLGTGVSAHISAPGYVGAAPYAGPGSTAVVVTWLDAGQLAVVDATEPNYRRVRLPERDFPVTLPDGTAVSGCRLYASRHGVLAPGGVPLTTAPQPELLTALLDRSAALRELLGPGPRDWVRRAAADPAVRAAGTAVFAREGWPLRQAELLAR